MKNKILRIITLTLIVAVLVTAVCVNFCGCSATYSSISTVEDLYAMKSNRSYKLTCDIDLRGALWTPLQVRNFEGNGFTISNATINDTSECYGGFFAKARSVKNVTFENILAVMSFSSSGNSPCGGVVAGYVSNSIDNVSVRDCEITVNAISTQYYQNFGIAVGRVEKSISNVIVENCTGSFNVQEGISNIGGVVGYDYYGSTKNCKVINSTIELLHTAYGQVCVGGISGMIGNYNLYDDLSYENSFLIDSKIEVVKSKGETSCRVGGIIGSLVPHSDASLCRLPVLNCGTINNMISVTSDKNYSVGGIVGNSQGKIENCLSDGNTFDCKVTAAATDSSCNVGGICGVTVQTIARCVSQNNNISGTQYAGNSYTRAENISACGIVAKTEGSINSCAVYRNYLSGNGCDVFAKKGSSVFNSYIVGENGFSNTNEVEAIDLDDWSKIISKLSLNSDVWEMVDGQLSMVNAKLEN